MRESLFQRNLIRKLRDMFEGCIILKNDPTYLQGVPDILILFRNKWAALETKRTPYSRKQPNQLYYVDLMNQMSYAAFVCPENEEDVLNDLQQTFRPRRSTRISQR
jgi:hypothetical protein